LEELISYRESFFVLFPVIALLFAPILHEFSHILMLKILNCDYTFTFHVSPKTGFEFIIEPFCDLNYWQTILLLSSGMLGNVIPGIIFLVLTFWYVKKGKCMRAYLYTIFSGGFFFLPITSFFLKESDLVNILEIVNVKLSHEILYGCGIFLICALLLYLYKMVKFVEVECIIPTERIRAATRGRKVAI
jgi:hypothetical protein